MPVRFSAADIASELGVVPQTITRHARAAKIGQKIGGWSFDAAEKRRLVRLVRDGPGNPEMVPGNDLWRRRKK